jgi:DNA-binding MarR family transcriptional regulator
MGEVKGGRKEKGLTEFEAMVLKDIGKNRFSTTSDRYARLGLNVYQGNKAKDSLIERGLVEVKELPTPTGRFKLLSPTEEGLAVLESLGVNPNVSHRMGGIEHMYWKKKLAEHFREKGFSVQEEVPLGGGKSVDLVAENDKEKIGIEIETGKSDGFYNLVKDMKGGFDRVIIAEIKKKSSEKDR